MNDLPLTGELDTLLAHADAAMGDAEARLCDFLRIPSISAQPSHAADCIQAGEWARDQLRALGFTADLKQTRGHPCVLAHHPGPGPNAPHLLFYGHYDVQPADPVDLWTNPPFEPTRTEGPNGPRIVARGATDDKGQVVSWIEAFRAWTEHGGGLPVQVTCLIEGEEEVGSLNLDPFLAENRDALARADIAVISDTPMWNIDTPSITTRLRGMAYVELALHASRRDLHSGMYGGVARNPLTLLTAILGQIHDADGHVTIPGFYDGVPEVSAAQLAEWEGLAFDEAAFLGDIGLSVTAGERNLPALVRLWARPTAELNGIWGGYMGTGAKTVIPTSAHAKISFRLVGDQDPEDVVAAFEAFVHARLPADVRADFQLFGASPGIEVPTDSAYVRAARAVLEAEYGRPSILMGCGDSIPVVGSFRRLLGIDSLLLGFGLDDDQAHSPDEKFELTCFRHAIRSHIRLMGELGAA